MNFLNLFAFKEDKERKAFNDGFRYAQEQLILYGDDPVHLERLESESLGWENDHPFDRGMREAITKYENQKRENKK